MPKKTKSNRKKREVMCISLGVDTARVVHRESRRLGHSKSALVRFLLDSWAKTQKKGA